MLAAALPGAAVVGRVCRGFGVGGDSIAPLNFSVEMDRCHGDRLTRPFGPTSLMWH